MKNYGRRSRVGSCFGKSFKEGNFNDMAGEIVAKKVMPRSGENLWKMTAAEVQI